MQEEKKKLVNQARKGDTHAFAKLYEEIYPDLYRFAFGKAAVEGGRCRK